MRNSSLITKSLIAVSILASCEKDPIDEIQDDYLYEMMTQEEVLVEETNVESSTQSSTIELTSTQSSTIELSDTQSSTIEITQVESTTVELTQTDSTTVEITNVATTTTVVENNNDDSNDDSNESNDSNESSESNDSNDSQVDNSNDNTSVVEAPAQPVVSQVASPVAVVDNTPQPIVVNSTDLDWETFDVNAQDIVIHDGVEYTSVEFEALVDAHVQAILEQEAQNEAQVEAHNNVEAPVAQVDNSQPAVNNNLVDVAVMIDVDSNDLDNITIQNFFYDGQAEIGQTISVGVSIQVKDGYKLSSLVGGSEVIDNGNENYLVKYHAVIDGNSTLTIGNKQVYNTQVTIEVEKK